jgi:hypothetical protein
VRSTGLGSNTVAYSLEARELRAEFRAPGMLAAGSQCALCAAGGGGADDRERIVKGCGPAGGSPKSCASRTREWLTAPTGELGEAEPALYEAFEVTHYLTAFFTFFIPASVFDWNPVSSPRATRVGNRRAKGLSRLAVALRWPHAPSFPGRGRAGVHPIRLSSRRGFDLCL